MSTKQTNTRKTQRGSSETLSFTVTKPGTARRIEFPLHPQTGNARNVGNLLADLLETITWQIDNCSGISDGDVLQSICMALAVRMNMVDATPRVTRELVLKLIEQANEAVSNGTDQPAFRL